MFNSALTIKEVLRLTVKPESTVRCSDRPESVRAIKKGRRTGRATGKHVRNPSIIVEARSDVAQLLSSVLHFNFIVYLECLTTILGKIDPNQRRLQDPAMTYRETTADL